MVLGSKSNPAGAQLRFGTLAIPFAPVGAPGCLAVAALVAHVTRRDSVKFDSVSVVLSILPVPSAHLWANTGVFFGELSFSTRDSRLECGVHDRLHI